MRARPDRAHEFRAGNGRVSLRTRSAARVEQLGYGGNNLNGQKRLTYVYAVRYTVGRPFVGVVARRVDHRQLRIDLARLVRDLPSSRSVRERYVGNQSADFSRVLPEDFDGRRPLCFGEYGEASLFEGLDKLRLQ